MSFSFGKELPVKDGLIFYLDAINPASHPPSSNYWKSLSKDVSIGKFDATYPPIFNTNYNGKKVIEFNGTDTFLSGSFNSDAFGGQNYLDLNSGDLTVEIFFSINELQTSKGILTIGYDEIGDQYQYSVGVSQGSSKLGIWVSVQQSGSSTYLTNEELGQYNLMHVCFGDDPDYDRNVYMNAQAIDKHPYGTSSLPINLWYVGRVRSDYYSGSVSYIKVYNRILTQSEITKNYLYAINERKV